jgi:hypothetical protein
MSKGTHFSTLVKFCMQTHSYEHAHTHTHTHTHTHAHTHTHTRTHIQTRMLDHADIENEQAWTREASTHTLSAHIFTHISDSH